MSECGRVFDPDDWEEKYATRAIPNDVIKCHRPVVGPGLRCKYHQPLRGTDVDITPEEVFEDLLEEEDVFGAVFESLHFEELSLPKSDVDGILKNVVFTSQFDVEDADIHRQLTFDGCIFERVRVDSLNATDSLNFKGCLFRNRTRIGGVHQSETTRIVDCTFAAEAELSGKFEERVVINSSFEEGLLVKNSTFGGEFDLSRTTFEDDTFLHENRFNGLLKLRHTDPDVRFYISESYVSDISCAFRSNTPTLLLCHGSKIASGTLVQPNSGSTYYDLTNVTLGDVRIRPEAPLDHYYFNETKYDGFPFYDHRDVFGSVKWRLHEFDPDLLADISKPYTNLCSSITPPPLPRYNFDTELKDNETTYLLARKAAAEQGDNRSASNLYIVEMKARKQRHRHAALASKNLSIWKKAIEFTYYVKNLFHHWSSHYGERTIVPIVWSLGVTVVWAVYYTLFGALVLNEKTRTIQSVTGSDSMDVWEFFLNNLYFSGVTFTTLGYGDVSPADTATKLAATAESFMGAFLVALLVFTLGRQISR